MNFYLSVVDAHPSIATGSANVPAPSANFSRQATDSLSSTRLGIPERFSRPGFIPHMKKRLLIFFLPPTLHIKGLPLIFECGSCRALR
jgi:hypothetical protein